MITLLMAVLLICIYASVASWTWEWSGLRARPLLVRLIVTAVATAFGVWVFAAWLAWSVVGRQRGPLARARYRGTVGRGEWGKRAYTPAQALPGSLDDYQVRLE